VLSPSSRAPRGRRRSSVGVTPDLTGRFDAIELVRVGAAALGGKGGGGRGRHGSGGRSRCCSCRGGAGSRRACGCDQAASRGISVRLLVNAIRLRVCPTSIGKAPNDVELQEKSGISGRDADAVRIMQSGVDCIDAWAMYQAKAGARRMTRMSAPAFLFSLLAVVVLVGCAGSPVHLDPLSVDGRDGGGPTPSYPMLMRIGAAAQSGGDLPNAVGVYRRAAEMAPQEPAPLIAAGDVLLQMGAINEAIVTLQCSACSSW